MQQFLFTDKGTDMLDWSKDSRFAIRARLILLFGGNGSINDRAWFIARELLYDVHKTEAA